MVKLSHVRIDMHNALSAGGDMAWYYRVSLVGHLDTSDAVPCDPYKTPWYKASAEWFCVREVANGLLEARYADDIAQHLAEHYGIDVIDTTEE